MKKSAFCCILALSIYNLENSPLVWAQTGISAPADASLPQPLNDVKTGLTNILSQYPQTPLDIDKLLSIAGKVQGLNQELEASKQNYNAPFGEMIRKLQETSEQIDQMIRNSMNEKLDSLKMSLQEAVNSGNYSNLPSAESDWKKLSAQWATLSPTAQAALQVKTQEIGWLVALAESLRRSGIALNRLDPNTRRLILDGDQLGPLGIRLAEHPGETLANRKILRQLGTALSGGNSKQTNPEEIQARLNHLFENDPETGRKIAEILSVAARTPSPHPSPSQGEGVTGHTDRVMEISAKPIDRGSVPQPMAQNVAAKAAPELPPSTLIIELARRFQALELQEAPLLAMKDLPVTGSLAEPRLAGIRREKAALLAFAADAHWIKKNEAILKQSGQDPDKLLDRLAAISRLPADQRAIQYAQWQLELNRLMGPKVGPSQLEPLERKGRAVYNQLNLTSIADGTKIAPEDIGLPSKDIDGPVTKTTINKLSGISFKTLNGASHFTTLDGNLTQDALLMGGKKIFVQKEIKNGTIIQTASDGNQHSVTTYKPIGTDRFEVTFDNKPWPKKFVHVEGNAYVTDKIVNEDGSYAVPTEIPGVLALVQKGHAYGKQRIQGGTMWTLPEEWTLEASAITASKNPKERDQKIDEITLGIVRQRLPHYNPNGADVTYEAASIASYIKDRIRHGGDLDASHTQITFLPDGTLIMSEHLPDGTIRQTIGKTEATGTGWGDGVHQKPMGFSIYARQAQGAEALKNAPVVKVCQYLGNWGREDYRMRTESNTDSWWSYIEGAHVEQVSSVKRSYLKPDGTYHYRGEVINTNVQVLYDGPGVLGATGQAVDTTFEGAADLIAAAGSEVLATSPLYLGLVKATGGDVWAAERDLQERAKVNFFGNAISKSIGDYWLGDSYHNGMQELNLDLNRSRQNVMQEVTDMGHPIIGAVAGGMNDTGVQLLHMVPMVKGLQVLGELGQTGTIIKTGADAYFQVGLVHGAVDASANLYILQDQLDSREGQMAVRNFTSTFLNLVAIPAFTPRGEAARAKLEKPTEIGLPKSLEFANRDLFASRDDAGRNVFQQKAGQALDFLGRSTRLVDLGSNLSDKLGNFADNSNFFVNRGETVGKDGKPLGSWLGNMVGGYAQGLKGGKFATSSQERLPSNQGSASRGETANGNAAVAESPEPNNLAPPLSPEELKNLHSIFDDRDLRIYLKQMYFQGREANALIKNKLRSANRAPKEKIHSMLDRVNRALRPGRNNNPIEAGVVGSFWNREIDRQSYKDCVVRAIFNNPALRPVGEAFSGDYAAFLRFFERQSLKKFTDNGVPGYIERMILRKLGYELGPHISPDSADVLVHELSQGTGGVRASMTWIDGDGVLNQSEINHAIVIQGAFLENGVWQFVVIDSNARAPLIYTFEELQNLGVQYSKLQRQTNPLTGHPLSDQDILQRTREAMNEPILPEGGTLQEIYDKIHNTEDYTRTQGAAISEPDANATRTDKKARIAALNVELIESWHEQKQAEYRLNPEDLNEIKQLDQLMLDANLPNGVYLHPNSPYFESTSRGMVDQGIKLRIGDPGTPEGRIEVLRQFLSIIKDPKLGRAVDFKVARTMKALPSDQAGKFITIYTETPAEARKIAETIDAAFKGKGFSAKSPVTDLTFGESGLISWRYGSFINDQIRPPGSVETTKDIKTDPVANLLHFIHAPDMQFWIDQAREQASDRMPPQRKHEARSPQEHPQFSENQILSMKGPAFVAVFGKQITDIIDLREATSHPERRPEILKKHKILGDKFALGIPISEGSRIEWKNEFEKAKKTGDEWSKNYWQNQLSDLNEVPIIDQHGLLGVFEKGPKLVYHGSATAGIRNFNSAENTTIGEGLYSTSDPTKAIRYANRRLASGGSSNGKENFPSIFADGASDEATAKIAAAIEDIRKSEIKKPVVYSLDIQNLKFLDLRIHSNAQKTLEGFRPVLDHIRVNSNDLHLRNGAVEAIIAIDSGQWPHLQGVLRAGVLSGAFSKYVASLGYDGLIAFEGGEGGSENAIGDHDSYVVFDPTKIKIVREERDSNNITTASALADKFHGIEQTVGNIESKALEALGLKPKAVADAEPFAVQHYFDPETFQKLHPEPEGVPIYHDMDHSLRVAQMAMDFARGRGLAEADVKFIGEVALLHDIDPARKPGTPARVPETLRRLEMDFSGELSLDGRPGHSILKDRFGWDEMKLKMAQAMIQRTEFPFTRTDRYRQMLAELPPGNRRFVLREGALLSEYADKLSHYSIEDFGGAIQRVRGLVHEINTVAGKPVTDLAMLDTYGFLSKAGADGWADHDIKLARELGIQDFHLPNRNEVFARLPEHYGKTFDNNLRGFSELREKLANGQTLPAIQGALDSVLGQWAAETDPAKRNAFALQSQELQNELRSKSAELGQAPEAHLDAFELKHNALSIQDSPEFAKIVDLPLSKQEKLDIIASIAKEMFWPPSVEKARRVAQELSPLVPDGSKHSPQISDLAQAQTWRGQALAPHLPPQGSVLLPVLEDEAVEHKTIVEQIAQAYHRTLSENSSPHYEGAEANARKQGLFIETEGGQRMPRQTRETCAYGAICNLFWDDVEADRLQTKDVLRLARSLNPSFANRSAKSSLNPLQIEAVITQLAESMGKDKIIVPIRDLVRFMQSTGRPVLVGLQAGESGHAVLLGNPFIVEGPGNSKTVVFETYDTNNPTDKPGYITAEDVGRFIITDPISVIPKGSPWEGLTNNSQSRFSTDKADLPIGQRVLPKAEPSEIKVGSVKKYLYGKYISWRDGPLPSSVQDMAVDGKIKVLPASQVPRIPGGWEAFSHGTNWSQRQWHGDGASNLFDSANTSLIVRNDGVPPGLSVVRLNGDIHGPHSSSDYLNKMGDYSQDALPLEIRILAPRPEASTELPQEVREELKRYHAPMNLMQHPAIPPGTTLVRIARAVEDGKNVFYFVPDYLLPYVPDSLGLKSIPSQSPTIQEWTLGKLRETQSLARLEPAILRKANSLGISPSEARRDINQLGKTPEKRPELLAKYHLPMKDYFPDQALDADIPPSTNGNGRPSVLPNEKAKSSGPSSPNNNRYSIDPILLEAPQTLKGRTFKTDRNKANREILSFIDRKTILNNQNNIFRGMSWAEFKKLAEARGFDPSDVDFLKAVSLGESGYAAQRARENVKAGEPGVLIQFIGSRIGRENVPTSNMAEYQLLGFTEFKVIGIYEARVNVKKPAPESHVFSTNGDRNVDGSPQTPASQSIAASENVSWSSTKDKNPEEYMLSHYEKHVHEFEKRFGRAFTPKQYDAMAQELIRRGLEEMDKKRGEERSNLIIFQRETDGAWFIVDKKMKLVVGFNYFSPAKIITFFIGYPNETIPELLERLKAVR